jgi:hypothetical protein
MAYIETVSEADAAGTLATIYDDDLKSMGYVPNYAQAMSLRPEVIAAWRALSRAIRANLRIRRYELVTYAAALALKCRY